MSQAETLKHLSEDQYGGQNGRGAVDIVLGKMFKNETFNFKGQTQHAQTATQKHVTTESYH
eukprot:13849012-Ditylum_brightwellii.AAC.1